MQAPIPDEGPTTGTTVDRVTFTGDGYQYVFGAGVAGRDVSLHHTRTSNVWYGLIVPSHGGTIANNSASGDCAAISVSSQGLGLASDVVVTHNRIEAPQACPVEGGAGIAVEDAPGTIVEHNRVTGIDDAIFVFSGADPGAVSPSPVTVRDNRIVDSCRGVVTLGVSGVEVRKNRITGKVGAPCFLRGVGVDAATPNTTVADNTITLTVDVETHLFDGTPAAAAGISVATSFGPPDNDRIVGNRVRLMAGPAAERLGVVDLFWDRSGNPPPVFHDNRCQTSDPAGLCEARSPQA